MKPISLLLIFGLLFSSCTKRSELELQLSQEDTFWGLHTCGNGENKNECDSNASYYAFNENGEIEEFYESLGGLEELFIFRCGNEPKFSTPNWSFFEKDSILFLKSAEFKVYRYNTDTIYMRFVKYPELKRELIRSKPKMDNASRETIGMAESRSLHNDALKCLQNRDTLSAYIIWLKISNNGAPSFKDTIKKYIGYEINFTE